VDCTVEKDVCSKNQIRGYPTVKLFVQGKEEPVQYQKARTLEAMQEFLAEQTKEKDQTVEL
jgi:hypothetical protein